MKITRKEFLHAAAGGAAFATIPASGALISACARTESDAKIKRGISIYSYCRVYGVTMTLEDCFADMYDMGAKGLEILSSHVYGYPNPTDEWLENWFALLKKYEITPVEYGHWVESRMYPGRELTTQESYDMLVQDLRLAHKLGFTKTRTKIGVSDDILSPVKNWREFIEMALPVAEECNIKMCTEIHTPTLLTDPFLFDDYLDFIEKTGTEWFGFNVDFGVFQNVPIEWRKEEFGYEEGVAYLEADKEVNCSKPEDIIPLLPYTYCCHAKFQDMSEDCTDKTTPYPEVIKIMQDHGWEGYLLSEYEGPNKSIPGYASDQLRRQHVMLRGLLGV